MDEYYVCETCGTRGHISTLKKRATMPGDYCGACGEEDECAACGGLYQQHNLVYKADIKNYVCLDCLPHYSEVLAYIKPLVTIAEVSRKAA